MSSKPATEMSSGTRNPFSLLLLRRRPPACRSREHGRRGCRMDKSFWHRFLALLEGRVFFDDQSRIKLQILSFSAAWYPSSRLFALRTLV